jgi:hypothetical protein
MWLLVLSQSGDDYERYYFCFEHFSLLHVFPLTVDIGRAACYWCHHHAAMTMNVFIFALNTFFAIGYLHRLLISET